MRKKELTSSSLALGGKSLCLVIETNFCSTLGVLVPNLGCLLASIDLRGDSEVGAATAAGSVGGRAGSIWSGTAEGGRAEEEESAVVGMVEVLELRGGVEVGAEAVVDGGEVGVVDSNPASSSSC